MKHVLLLLVFIICASSLYAVVIHETGIASWYDSDPMGNLTANGERFDPNALHAAHKSLSFGTKVLVHNLHNGKETVVRINDRGPYVEGRIIDLTPAAAQAIGMLESGIAPVELSILYEPSVPESLYNRPGDTGWYVIQVGSFSQTINAYRLYEKLYVERFHPLAEIVGDSMIRISIRWISENTLQDTLQRLQEIGISEVLIKGGVAPLFD